MMKFFVFTVPFNNNIPSLYRGHKDMEVYAETEQEARDRLRTFPGFTGEERLLKIRWA